jgi:hypothetical protein
VTYLPAIQRAPHSAKRLGAARCWAGDKRQSLAVLTWLDWFMRSRWKAASVSGSDAIGGASLIWVEGIALARSASVWRDLAARMTEESVVTPKPFLLVSAYTSQKPVG